MKREILEDVGHMFTNNWITAQGDQKLNGFSWSAEWCLRDIKTYRTGIVIAILFICSGIILAIIDSLLGGILTSFTGILLGVGIIKNYQQGNTSKAIVKDWKPLRKELLKHGVITRIREILEKDYPKRDYVPHDEIRGLLVRSLDELMSILSSKLIDAQREGFPKNEEVITSRMYQLRTLTLKLNLKMDFDQYFS